MTPDRVGRRCETRASPPRRQPTPTRRPHDRDRPADLVLTGGAHRDDGRRPIVGQRPGRPGRPDRRGGHGRERRRAHRPVDPGHRAARPDRHAGLPGCPRPPGPRRPGPAALRAPRGSRSRTALRPVIAAYARSASRRVVDPRRRLVHGGVRGRHAAPRGSRPDRPGSAGLPDQSRRPRRLGQHARPSSSPA